MRRSLISLLITIFFSVLLTFVSYNYSPFEASGLENIIQRYGITEESEFREVVKKSVGLGVVWEFLNVGIVAAWSFALAGLVISFVVFLHLTVDKLFFKQFFEQPDLMPALRRGVLIFFVVYTLLCLHLMGALVWYTAVIAVLLLVIFEVGVVYLRRTK